MNDRVWGALLVALSATAFGAMAIFARFAYADGTDVVAVLFLRFTIAAALMSAFVVASGRRWPRGRNLAILLAMGAVGYVGQSLSFSPRSTTHRPGWWRCCSISTRFSSPCSRRWSCAGRSTAGGCSRSAWRWPAPR
jgi:hypothetical protein